MRVTHRMMTENAIQNMEDSLQRLYTLQQKASTMKNIQRASDDPSTASTVLTLRSTVEINKSYISTTQLSDDWMSATNTALEQMLDVAKRAVQLAQTGMADTQGADERQALADEMGSLLQQAVDIGNTSHLGNYIFAGFSTTTIPFILNSDSSVTYNGDTGVMLRQIGPSQTISQNIIGNTYFSDLFENIVIARDALNSNDSEAIQNALGGLESALELVNQSVTLNGTRQRQVKLTQERLENTQTDLDALLSEKEDVSMIEVAALLSNQETVYQAVLEVSNRAISALSLFDMLS